MKGCDVLYMIKRRRIKMKGILENNFRLSWSERLVKLYKWKDKRRQNGLRNNIELIKEEKKSEFVFLGSAALIFKLLFIRSLTVMSYD